MPEGREGLATACINVGGQDFLYAVGGRDPLKTVTGTVFYAKVLPHGPIRGWMIKERLLEEVVLFDSAIVSTHGRLYVLGGDDGRRSLDSVYHAQPQPGTGDTAWLSTSSLPVPVYLHAAVSLGDRIYVIGGYHYDPHSSISHPIAEIFSAEVLPSGALSGWTLESSLATLAEDGISAHTAVADEDQQCIYVIAGWLGSYSSGTPHDGVFRACVEGTGKLGPWESESEAVPLIPAGAVGIYYPKAAIVDNRVFVVGGTIYTSSSRESTDSVYVGSIDASGHLGNWMACTHCLPTNLERHGVAVASNGTLYIIGGKDRSLGNVHSATLFTPLLDFEKHAAPGGSVTYGDTVHYTLRLTNQGVRDLDGLTITDTVEANVTAALEFHDLPIQCQVHLYAADTITCAISSLELGETKDLGFQVTISQPATRSYSTPSSLQAPVGERDIDDAPATHFTPSTEVIDSSITHQLRPSRISGDLQPDDEADLRLEKRGDPALVVAGRALSYTLLVHNDGPSMAQDVAVVDYLPADATFILAAPPPSGTSPLLWSLGSILVGGSQEIQLVVQVDPGSSGILTNTAVVNGSTPDVNPDNNQDEVWTVVVRQADLRIEKMDNPDPVMPGERLTYTLVVMNEGPSDAQDVSVVDILPSDLELFATTPPPVGGPNPLEWQLDLPASQGQEIQVVAAVGPDGMGAVRNVAIVSSDIDPFLANNVDEEWTYVGTRPAPFAVINEAYACESTSTGSWCWYATYLNTDLRIYFPIAFGSTP